MFGYNLHCITIYITFVIPKTIKMSKDYDKPATFRIPKQLLGDCKAIAEQKDTNLSREVRRLLTEYRDTNGDCLSCYERLIDGALIKIKNLP